MAVGEVSLLATLHDGNGHDTACLGKQVLLMGDGIGKHGLEG